LVTLVDGPLADAVSTGRRVRRQVDRAGNDAILAEGFAFHKAGLAKARRRGRPPRRVGHNPLLRLSTRKQDVLRFPTDPGVPFTNGPPEQDGRRMKLPRISGGFRSEDGARDFAVFRSVLSTVSKQGWNVLKALERRPSVPDGSHSGGLLGIFGNWLLHFYI
jgi:hypothetical protein